MSKPEDQEEEKDQVAEVLKSEFHILHIFIWLTRELEWVMLIVFALLGLSIGWRWLGGFFVGLLFDVAFVLVVGVPAIILGQLASVMLDNRQLLREIRDAVRDLEPPQPLSPNPLFRSPGPVSRDPGGAAPSEW